MESLRGIDLNLLLVLDAVLRESSVTGAARRLGKSPPAVSHSLSKLRDLLDDPILVRAGRSMVPTPYAEELATSVSEAVRQAAEVLRPAGVIDPARLERTFRIIATDHVLAVIGPGLDRALTEAAPGVDLHVVPYGGPELDALRDGTVDLAIGVFPDPGPEMQRRKLFDDSFVCCTREGRGPLDFHAYVAASHVLVSPRGGERGLVDRILEERGTRRRVARTVPYFWSALELVAESDHVITISRRLAHRAAELLPLEIHRPPLDLPDYTLVVMWHPRFERDPTHRWFRDVLVTATPSSLPSE